MDKKELDKAINKVIKEHGETLRKLGDHNMSYRPSWDAYFMIIARAISLRSNCISRKVGAIIVKDNRIISTGYNGTPKGVKNCYEGGCKRCTSKTESGKKLEQCLCSHGEENAITQAACYGIAVKGAILYTTISPCLICAKMIINADIKEVIYREEYSSNETAFNILAEAKIIVRKLQEVV